MAKYLDNNGLLYFWQKIKNTFAAVTHSHAISDVTDLQTTLDGKAASSHSHAISDITSLQTTLDGKAPTSHASSATTYGAGTGSNYGHVKLSDATNGTAAAASGGTAATPKAVADALTAAKDYADGKADTNTTYTLTKSGSTITLTGSDSSTTSVTDDDTTYEPFTGATGSTAGTVGLVPRPTATHNNRLLFADGTWDDMYFISISTKLKKTIQLCKGQNSDSTPTVLASIDIAQANTSSAGLLSSNDKTKLNGIEDDANNYVHPSYTAHSTSAIYKFTNNSSGHVNAATAATASDIVTLLGTTAVNRATADASGNSIADTYALKSEIAGVYKYVGSVANESALPTTGQSTGDVYNIETASTYGAAGANVAWNGTAWDSLGEIFALESITNADIDTIVAS